MKEESLLLLSDLQKLINQVVLIDYTIIILGGDILNKKTVALTEEQYKLIITTIRQGFICSDGHIVKPNNRVATALSLEANLGLRISDILHLRLSDIIRDGDRYRLNIIEQKTQKRREFTVPTDIYIFTFSHMRWKIIYIQMQNYLIYLKELL